MIDIEKFKNSTDEFDNLEGRTNFFLLAKNLIDNGFEIEGLLFILSTWNFAVFRYSVKQFDVDNFRKTLNNLKPCFDKFDGKNFTTINLDYYKCEIQTIFNSLSHIKGIEFTGAPKLMHLKNPDVFVMWDSYIRGEKPKKHYNQLELFQKKEYGIKKYSKSFEGYFEFLKDMQNKFHHINFQGGKTITKAIDEFNFINITLPIQSQEKQNKKNKKLSPK